MTVDAVTQVPVWTVATEDVNVPDLMGDAGMTSARLTELRTALATLAEAPIATIEVHPIPNGPERSGGIVLHAASPLALHLSHLVTETVGSAPRALNVAASGEVLYRMVIPAKVAAQVGNGIARPMASKAVAGGVYGAIRDRTGVVAQATLVPVTGKAAVSGGGTTGAVAAAGATGMAAGALTVAAPLVLMAVAVSASAYADQQRTEAIERITELLEQLRDDKLDDERSELDGCRDAIDKATSIILDQGRIGLSLGLDSAVHAIGKSIERARRRLAKWQELLAGLPAGPVELAALQAAFPGLDGDGGTFRAHLELARLAIALKRRVLVLQAVEHAQAEGATRPFATFVRSLQDDERRVDELEAGIASVLLRLSSVELKCHGGLRSLVVTHQEVDNLLRAVYRLRALADDLDVGSQRADVAIEIERRSDGSLLVFPACPA